MNHLDYLRNLVPDIGALPILDVGAGKGKFVIVMAQAGFDVTGLEFNPAYIESANQTASEVGVSIRMVQGKGEKLPFPDASFGFVNVSEVIEHVENPERVMREIFRVLAPGGHVYMSVPNRYGMYDPHFHLFGVNWIPRRFADRFISLFGHHKNYADGAAGQQRLADMYYYTYPSIKTLLEGTGFSVEDIRAIRIQREFLFPVRNLISFAYPLLRTLYFDSFHLLLARSANELL
ncbi:MAG TPA: class I SAM-dependent methyltransferase [Candidatus Paceibacterota bacterium]